MLLFPYMEHNGNAQSRAKYASRSGDGPANRALACMNVISTLHNATEAHGQQQHTATLDTPGTCANRMRQGLRKQIDPMVMYWDESSQTR
jgi:hypothetical protein